MKNLKKVLFTFLLVAGFMLFSVGAASAKKGDIVGVPDPNPDGTTPCSIVVPEGPAAPNGDEDEDDAPRESEDETPEDENGENGQH